MEPLTRIKIRFADSCFRYLNNATIDQVKEPVYV
jgi:hypothetical protein